MTYALLPYQQKWFEDTSPVKLYTKSRRIGISWSEAADAALTASRADGMNVTYICYDKDITRQFIKDCGEWAKAYNLAASEIEEEIEVFRDGSVEKSVLIFRIYFASGFEIEAIAGTPRKLRGRKGRVIIDEAAFLDDLGSVIEASLALLIWGGDLRIITTYNGIENEYYELEQDVLSGKLPYSRHYTTFDDAIAQGLYKRICLVQGKEWTPEKEQKFVQDTRDHFGDKATQELDCIPKSSSGKYFALALLERAQRLDRPILVYACSDEFVFYPESRRIQETRDWIRLNLEPLLALFDPNCKSGYGLDFARSGAASVLMPLQETEKLKYVCPFGFEMRNVPFEQQWQIVLWWIEHLPRFAGAAHDATGNGAYLAEVAVQKRPGKIHAIKLSRGWYAENFPRYKAAFEDDRIELPRSANWRDDHRFIELEKNIPTVPDQEYKGTDGFKRHGDAAVAGVMAMFAMSNADGLPDFEAEIGTRNSDQFAGFSSGGGRYAGWL